MDNQDIDELDEFEELTITDASTPTPVGPLSNTQTLSNDELERFRREWQQDLQDRKLNQRVGQNVPRESGTVRSDPPPSSDRSFATEESAAEADLHSLPRSPKATFQALTQKPINIVDPKQHALDLYSKAVEYEQGGKLNDALIHYRKAFKFDDNVDRIYQQKTKAAPPSTSSTDAFSFQRTLQVQPDYHPSASASSSRASLPSILQQRPTPLGDLQFLPQEEEKPVPISSLPVELLEPIFARLDIASLERFGSTCWHARQLTATSLVWRRLVSKVYIPPMIPDQWTVQGLREKHAGDWRTTFIEEPRIRMDGCYISVCHYIRPGAGDEWVAITHMITYHRFLRFYPDGSVISFLTTDHPSEVVPLLRSTLRAKGLHFGRWRIDHGEKPRVLITDLLDPGLSTPKYEFEMELGLRSTGRGKWNKLDMINYASINLSDGESLALSLKHQKPFYFSKVKSYNPPL